MASQITSRIGPNLRAARHAKHLTQTELARMIDASETQLAKWEAGTHRPRDVRLEQLAEALGIDYIDFFREPNGDAAEFIVAPEEPTS